MRHVLAALFAFSMLMPVSAFAEGPTADEIVDRALDQNAMGFQSGKAQLTLKIEDASGDSRTRKLEVKSKKINDLGRTLVTLTSPKEVRGQAFLFAEKKGEDDVWMYLPAFKVTRRIEGGQKNGSFLGSHFTYADLESRDLKESTYRKLPDEKIGKYAVHVVEAIPKKGASSDYEKVVVYVRQSDYIPLKVKFYGKGEKLAKTLFVEKLDKTSGGQTYAKQMTLRPKSGGFTTIVINGLDEAELPDSIFSRDQLGK
jgi:hypothetical protein